MSLRSVVPPAEKPPIARGKLPWFVALVMGLLLVAGFSGGRHDGAATPVASQPAASTLPTSVVMTMVDGSATSGSTTTARVEAVAPQPLAGRAVVPDVVGMNHEQARQVLQAAGFPRLLEEDATGRGRLLVWDRLWQVVAQSVPGGTTLAQDEPITLTATRIGE